jgi:small-conductance mechanosensitive channel
MTLASSPAVDRALHRALDAVGWPAGASREWPIGIAYALAILLVALLASRVLTRLLASAVRSITRRTTTELDDQIVAIAEGPTRKLVLVAGLYYALLELPLSPAASRILGGVVYLLAVWVAIRLALRVIMVLIAAYGKRVQDPTGRVQFEKDYLPLLTKVIAVFLTVVGLIAVLHRFGQNVTSLVAALGVGGIAIGLAAKDTLTNMIAGFTILVDRPFRPGDRIKLATGEIGEVIDVGTRSTRLRLLDQNMLIAPNSELANSRVVNYNFPTHATQVRLDIGLAYGTDVERARAAIRETVRAQPDVLADPAPAVQLFGFGESALQFVAFYTVSQFADAGAVQDRVRTQLLARLASDGVKIPFPTREVVVVERKG